MFFFANGQIQLKKCSLAPARFPPSLLPPPAISCNYTWLIACVCSKFERMTTNNPANAAHPFPAVTTIVVGQPPNTGAPDTDTTTSSKLDIEKVTWADVSVDESGDAIGVLGHPWDYYGVRELCIMANNFRVKGTRNIKKRIVIEKIVSSYRLKKAYKNLHTQPAQPPEADDGNKAPRKQVQCPFRLMNVLFSDEFAMDFADLGKIATRQVLDSGKAGNQQHFWEQVASAFIENSAD